MRAMDHHHAAGTRRKRKAETQDNERLHKRLGLLNLGGCLCHLQGSWQEWYSSWPDAFPERNGERLYVPVEQRPGAPRSPQSPSPRPTTTTTTTMQDDDAMRLDDTKHKVYIYDLDAELADGGESDASKLVFLPDIQKHLRETRIPPMVFANADGELAGWNNQLVLYNIPSSLSVPEEKDSVRKAIIESRARSRAALQTDGTKSYDAQDWHTPRAQSGASGCLDPSEGLMEVEPTEPMAVAPLERDPDAMDIG